MGTTQAVQHSSPAALALETTATIAAVTAVGTGIISAFSQQWQRLRWVSVGSGAIFGSCWVAWKLLPEQLPMIGPLPTKESASLALKPTRNPTIQITGKETSTDFYAIASIPEEYRAILTTGTIVHLAELYRFWYKEGEPTENWGHTPDDGRQTRSRLPTWEVRQLIERIEKLPLQEIDPPSETNLATPRDIFNFPKELHRDAAAKFASFAEKLCALKDEAEEEKIAQVLSTLDLNDITEGYSIFVQGVEAFPSRIITLKEFIDHANRFARKTEGTEGYRRCGYWLWKWQAACTLVGTDTTPITPPVSVNELEEQLFT